ncbi:hypothetical protein LTR64_006330 [Lithohypha guttulata]|uniref:uncharacterized protein n=1 Tax=Lithohypha guttulata TaxID=1690604 RepID=UPI002DE16E6A|nr:hypothetical protein LTR51_001872 [Lithohypha guttulata]
MQPKHILLLLATTATPALSKDTPDDHVRWCDGPKLTGKCVDLAIAWDGCRYISGSGKMGQAGSSYSAENSVCRLYTDFECKKDATGRNFFNQDIKLNKDKRYNSFMCEKGFMG